MNSADRILLDGLRLVADVSDDVWTLVEAEVAKAGSVLAVGGQARVEIERAVAKARELVEKHPGHADQSVHGSGKKGGATSDFDDASQSAAQGVGMAWQKASSAQSRMGSVVTGEPAVFAEAKIGAKKAVNFLRDATGHLQDKSISKSERIFRARNSIIRGQQELRMAQGKRGGAVRGRMFENMEEIGTAFRTANVLIDKLASTNTEKSLEATVAEASASVPETD